MLSSPPRRKAGAAAATHTARRPRRRGAELQTAPRGRAQRGKARRYSRHRAQARPRDPPFGGHGPSPTGVAAGPAVPPDSSPPLPRRDWGGHPAYLNHRFGLFLRRAATRQGMQLPPAARQARTDAHRILPAAPRLQRSPGALPPPHPQPAAMSPQPLSGRCEPSPAGLSSASWRPLSELVPSPLPLLLPGS